MNYTMTIQAVSLFFLMLFFAITFIQSAADKILDRKGNLEFLNSHFKNSPLKGAVGAMLSTLTFVEVVSGLSAAYAAIRWVVVPAWEPTFFALCVGSVNILMLLTGQRLAKDYAGAASLAGYFVLIMAGFILLK